MAQNAAFAAEPQPSFPPRRESISPPYGKSGWVDGPALNLACHSPIAGFFTRSSAGMTAGRRGAAALLAAMLICGAAAAFRLRQHTPKLDSQPTRSPRVVLGKKHPGKVTGFSEEGVTVDLKDGGTQIVQFGEIWRIRRAL